MRRHQKRTDSSRARSTNELDSKEKSLLITTFVKQNIYLFYNFNSIKIYKYSNQIIKSKFLTKTSNYLCYSTQLNLTQLYLT